MTQNRPLKPKGSQKGVKKPKSKQVIDIYVFYRFYSFKLLIYKEFLNGTICMKWPENPEVSPAEPEELPTD